MPALNGSLALSHAPAAGIFRPPQDILADVRALAVNDLATAAKEIDEGAYPEGLLRILGGFGAFGMHAAPGAGLGPAIEGISALASVCGSTAFMAWCQSTLVWYLLNSENEELKQKHLLGTSLGRQLGGSGLSNPMKSFYDIETLKLRGARVEGGYRVKGVLPWVSNLGRDHLFGAVFALDGRGGEPVMALIDCSDPAVTLKPCEPFLGMDGTGTYTVQVRNLFIPDALILAHAAMPFVARIRAGFILLQAGMAIGLIRDCIALVREVDGQLGHVNRYLDLQADQMEEMLASVEVEVGILAASPHETSDAYFRRVVASRLAAGEMSVLVAHNAMLHCGARGYVAAHRCQRRLREAYFVAIVTPAVKQLRLMLDQLPAK